MEGLQDKHLKLQDNYIALQGEYIKSLQEINENNRKLLIIGKEILGRQFELYDPIRREVIHSTDVKQIFSKNGIDIDLNINW
jgi:hypothetical protein